MGLHTFFVGKEKIEMNNIDENTYIQVCKTKEQEQFTAKLQSKTDFLNLTDKEKINKIAEKLGLQ